MNSPSTVMFQINKPADQGAPFGAMMLAPSGTTFESVVDFEICPSSIDRANEILEKAIQKVVQSCSKVLKINSTGNAELLDETIEAGRAAFEEIVKDGQKRGKIEAKLRELADGSTITIMFDRAHPIFVPWEFLVYNYSSAAPLYQNFWGYRHVLCRQTFSSYRNFGDISPASKPRLALLAADELSHVDSIKRPYLIGLAGQNRILYTDFAERARRVMGDAKKKRELGFLLNERDLRIVNFACCIIPVEAANELFRVLLHDMELDLNEIRQLLILYENKPLVLLNLRCREKTNEIASTNIHFALYGAQYFYWVDAFLELGAAGVIATGCGIPDLFAATFAKELYQYLIAGDRLGEALLNARRNMLGQYQNPLGLAYTLYTHPDKQVVPISRRPEWQKDIGEVRELVRQDQLQGALDRLPGLGVAQDEVDQLIRQLNYLQGKVRKGIITDEEVTVKRSRITLAILGLLSSLEKS